MVQPILRSLSLLVPLALLLAAPEAEAGARWAVNSWVYAAPFVCGSSPGSAGLPQGEFLATLGVLNAGEAQRLRIRVALSDPDDLATSDPAAVQLHRFEAMQLDCRQLLSDMFFDTQPSPAPFSGFVLVESQEPLEVTLTQSTTGPEGDVSISTQSIDGRLALHPRIMRSTEICHSPPGNRRNRHTITVDRDAVSSHLAHGDHRGECEDDDDDDHGHGDD